MPSCRSPSTGGGGGHYAVAYPSRPAVSGSHSGLREESRPYRRGELLLRGGELLPGSAGPAPGRKTRPLRQWHGPAAPPGHAPLLAPPPPRAAAACQSRGGPGGPARAGRGDLRGRDRSGPAVTGEPRVRRAGGARCLRPSPGRGVSLREVGEGRRRRGRAGQGRAAPVPPPQAAACMEPGGWAPAGRRLGGSLPVPVSGVAGRAGAEGAACRLPAARRGRELRLLAGRPGAARRGRLLGSLGSNPPLRPGMGTGGGGGTASWPGRDRASSAPAAREEGRWETTRACRRRGTSHGNREESPKIPSSPLGPAVFRPLGLGVGLAAGGESPKP